MTPALILHIGAGGVGLVAGAVAAGARKGERLHRLAGDVFFVAMLTMSAMALYLAVTIPGQQGNIGGGALTFYLVATAWATVRRPEGSVGAFEVAAMAVPALAAAAGLYAAWQAIQSPSGLFQTYPAPIFLAFAAVGLIAAGGDLKVILGGGIAGGPRIARHLWRMFVGLFVASGSFFLGKQADMPAMVRGSPVLIVLAFAPLAAMVFWLVWVRFGRFSARVGVAAGS